MILSIPERNLLTNTTIHKTCYTIKPSLVYFRYYTRLWLHDKGLEKFLHFETVESMPPLDEMAFWYPGQINDAINSYTLDVSERHVMKEGVHRFKASMSTLRQRSTIVVTKLLEYDRKFAADSENFSPQNILGYIKEIYMDKSQVLTSWLPMVLFVVMQHYLVSRGTPKSIPGTSDITLSLLLYYIHPQYAQFNLYVILLYRAFYDPVKTLLLYTLALETWMLAASTLHGSYYDLILLSVLPTVIFATCVKVLKFQPVVMRHPETKGLVVSLSGHGFVDDSTNRLFEEKTVGWVTRTLLGLHIEEQFEWEELETLKIQDCDISWDVIGKMIAPSVAAGNLKHLLIGDNRCLTNDDVVKLIESLKDNESVEKLSVSFRVNRSFIEKAYHCFFWDSCRIQVTHAGMLAILKWATDHNSKKSTLKSINIQGIRVNDECIAHAKHLHVNKNIQILCTKSDYLNNNRCVSLCNNVLTRITCALIIILFSSAQLYLLFNSIESIISLLPEKQAMELTRLKEQWIIT